VRLELRDTKSGQVVKVERAEMSRENREAVFVSLAELAHERMPEALDAFEAALAERWSYLTPSRIDHAKMIAELRGRIGPGMTGAQFLLELQKVIGKGIDGHASVEDWEKSTPRGYLPFLIEPAGERFVAFRPDRSGFVEKEFPYVEALDGRKLAEWIGAASAYVPDGSPQYVRGHGLRMLRSVQFLRREMGSKEEPTIELGLVSADGNARKAATLNAADAAPVYGHWPRGRRAAEVPPEVQYVRVTSMDDRSAKALGEALRRARDDENVRGLIVDVRDNGGGGREPLLEMAAFLMKPGGRPRVINAAVQRRHPEHTARQMASRFLYPEAWKGWTGVEREAIGEFKKAFRPEWAPPGELYGEWHYMVLNRPVGREEGAFGKPVVVLLNAKCFSATDIFLSALKGWPNVTLVGTASGGGSANTSTVRLGDTPPRVRLGTMVSFQASGKLFDGRGVEPDVVVEPGAECFVGGRDGQLEEAVRGVRGKGH